MSRVLIIDDDPILLDTLASTLRLKLPDLHIETVDSTLASLERIRSIEYEAIICDGHQPRIEGVALVRALRKIHPERPVLLLLKKHDQDLIWQATNAGAYDILVKPVNEGALLLAMHRTIEASRLQCQVKREKKKLVATVGRMMRDLEKLYGAYGLPSHFEASMACLGDERQASRHYDELSPNLKVKGRDTVIGTQVRFIERLRMTKSYEP